MITIDPKEVSTGVLHSYLLSAVAPRPIAFASTVDVEGNVNLSPFSFFNVFSANPPILIFSPARRVRDNTIKHTLENVSATKEVVVNIVNYAMVQQASLSSTEYPKGVNEFVKAGFTEITSEMIKPPRVAEAPVQMECKVNDIIALGTEGGAGNLVICEVLKVHVCEKVLDADGKIDPEKLDAVARMGGNWYGRSKAGMFQIPKPLQTLGIGFDNLPGDLKNSSILTGNELAMLANVEALPHGITENSNISNERQEVAKKYLQKAEIEEAWNALCN